MEDKEKEELLKANRELAEENEKLKHNLITFPQILGGFVGIIIYAIYKYFGDYGWGYGDIIGLFLLAFLPGALFLGPIFDSK